LNYQASFVDTFAFVAGFICWIYKIVNNIASQWKHIKANTNVLCMHVAVAPALDWGFDARAYLDHARGSPDQTKCIALFVHWKSLYKKIMWFILWMIFFYKECIRLLIDCLLSPCCKAKARATGNMHCRQCPSVSLFVCCQWLQSDRHKGVTDLFSPWKTSPPVKFMLAVRTYSCCP